MQKTTTSPVEASEKSTALRREDYVHLHNHTHHSLLDGLQKIPKMVKHVSEQGMKAIAITDHGTLSGAIEFYKAAKSNNINPIIGIETYVATRKHTDKEAGTDKKIYHLILLAMNNKGYQNLMRLSTIANLDGYYYKPRIDHELLEKYHEGIIALSGCIGGEVGDALRYDDYEKAKRVASWYKKLFGDRYYLELQDHGHEWSEQKSVNAKIMALGDELDIPCVVTGDAHYLTHDDQEAHEVLLCVQTGSYLSDEKRMSLKDTSLHVTDPDEIIERWKETPEVISNTRAIADRCSVEIELGGILIPKFDVPGGATEKAHLELVTYQGLAERYADHTIESAAKLTIEGAKALLEPYIIERAEYELGVMSSMGFDGYFLIVSDFINWGKAQGIVFGPGRGSAAGSIVSYALRITDLDPMKYDLLFERFLNPDRISMPDIDIDIQDTRRDEVIQYTVEKYGQEQVAHIVTYGTMAARNAIRDVSRVLEVPYADADRLAKLVPPPVQGRNLPLEESVRDDPDMKAEYNSNRQSRRVIDLAIKLEGTMRSHGVHAAGVVIAPEDIVKYAPLEMAQKGVITTQYAMNPVEELGLLKMDFLGLSNLTTINNALKIIKRVHDVDIEILEIPIDDKKTFELLGRGETTGVFQLESAGMKRYIKQLKPNRFDDIIAMVALYRPGPMQFIGDFIDRKHGKTKITYDHENMKASLESTYGILVYQEQVMQIAQSLSGFTGGQADTLRKAIGKKKHDVMAKLKKDFVDGAFKKSGLAKKPAEKIWADWEKFADYAFNKSHAACYGLIAYQTAYLKAHYPAEFMAAVMTTDYDDIERLAIEITECNVMGIEVLPPDVNQSFTEFAVVPGKKQIRFGMAAIKNVGKGAVEEILRARQDGDFKGIEDFVSRVSTRVVNRKTWESLIKTGAFDSYAERHELLFNLDMILAFGSKRQKDVATGQTDLFGNALDDSQAPKLEFRSPGDDIDTREYLQWERDLLGLYLSEHPLDAYKDYLEDRVRPVTSIKEENNEDVVSVGGLISTVRQITTKSGKKMAFVQVEDMTGVVEIIVFPKIYEQKQGILVQDSIVEVSGKVNTKDRDGNDTGEIKILADDIKRVRKEHLKTTSSGEKKLYIHLKDPTNHAALLEVKKILNNYPGPTEAILVLGEVSKQAVRLPFTVVPDEQALAEVRAILDDDAVALK